MASASGKRKPRRSALRPRARRRFIPLYFFHVCNGNGFVEDEEGRELPDEAEARSAALTGARDIMAEEMRVGQLNPASFIEVEDGEHKHLFTLLFSEAYTVNPRPTD